MLDKLTPEQEEMMYKVRDEWLDRFFGCKTKPNLEGIRSGMEWLYSDIAELGKPEIIIVDSPKVAQYVSHIAHFIDEAGVERSQAVVKTDLPVNKPFWSMAIKILGVKTKGKGTVVNVTDTQKFGFGYYPTAGCYGWVALYEVFENCKVFSFENFTRYKELLKTGIYSCIELDKLCVVSTLPTKIERNENKELHSLNGAAIEFADGYGQHYISGRYFDPELFGKIPTMTAKDIIGLDNIEQRMVLLQTRDVKTLLEEMDAKLIDKTQRGNELYAIQIDEDRTLKALKYVCPSTNQTHVKYVNASHTCADTAQAESHHFTLEEYKSLTVET